MILHQSRCQHQGLARRPCFPEQVEGPLALDADEGDGEQCHGLDSRYTRSLKRARKAVAYWQTGFQVAALDVHDNSDADLDYIQA